jgi:hypothetical protein
LINHANDINLIAYEKRLDQIAAIVEREVHKILVHLAHEMPLSRSTKSAAALQDFAARAATAPESDADARDQYRSLLRLYTERLRFKASTSGASPPPEMLTYAQLLQQALRDPQTLH